MPAVEGYMTPGDSERLRKLLGQDEFTPEEWFRKTMICDDPPPDADAELHEAARAAASLKSEHILTKREIPIIGTDEVVDVWVKG